MATFTKNKLSGSTNGKPIKVAATATIGTTIHTAVSGASAWDEVWLWISNTTTVAVTVTIEYGGATDPDCLICKTVSIPPNSPPIPIVSGLLIQNSLVISAFGSSANVLLISGYVHNIV